MNVECVGIKTNLRCRMQYVQSEGSHKEIFIAYSFLSNSITQWQIYSKAMQMKDRMDGPALYIMCKNIQNANNCNKN